MIKHFQDQIDRAWREIAQARSIDAVRAAVHPLWEFPPGLAAAGLIDLAAYHLDWSAVLADEAQRLVARNPDLSNRQRIPFRCTGSQALALLQRQSHRWPIAALLSMHPDGYVREHAILELANDVRGAPFIANRQSDWVSKIATLAEQVLERAEFGWGSNGAIDVWTWRWAIENSRRIRGSGQRVLSRLLRDPDARRVAMTDPVAAKVVLASIQELHPGDPLVDIGLGSPHAAIRAATAARFRPHGDSLPVIERLMRDPQPAVRIEALRMAAEVAPGHAMIGQARLDANFRVRGQARILLGSQDHLRFYRTALPHSAAIEGIGETGKRADAESVLPFLRDEKSQMRRAAVSALAALDARETVPALKGLLGDPSPRVVREAIRALQILNATLNSEELGPCMFPVGPTSRVLIQAVPLMPRWESAVFLLRAGEYAALRDAATARLIGWANRMNLMGSPPQAGISEDFYEAIQASWLPDRLRRTLNEIAQRWR